MVWNYEDGLSSLWSHVLVFWQQQCSVRITSVHHRKWSQFRIFDWFWFDSWGLGPWRWLWQRKEILSTFFWIVSFCTFSSLHIFMFLSLLEFMYMPFPLWSSFYLDWSFSLPLSIKMLRVKLIQLLDGWGMEINLCFLL